MHERKISHVWRFQMCIRDSDHSITTYLDDLYEAIIVRDIMLRHNIREQTALRNVLAFLLDNICLLYTSVQVGFGKSASMLFRNSENSRTARLLTSFIRSPLCCCQHHLVGFPYSRRRPSGIREAAARPRCVRCLRGLRRRTRSRGR